MNSTAAEATQITDRAQTAQQPTRIVSAAIAEGRATADVSDIRSTCQLDRASVTAQVAQNTRPPGTRNGTAGTRRREPTAAARVRRSLSLATQAAQPDSAATASLASTLTLPTEATGAPCHHRPRCAAQQVRR